MKLRNKRTGEIGYTAVLQSKAIVVMDENAIQLGSYTSLAELNEEWKDMPEDYEEPKEYWFIDEFGLVQKEIEYYYEENKEAVHDKRIAVGNYFDTREEAEKAVEKLKAWKRLKDFGCGFMLDDHFTVKFVGPDARKITSAEEQKSLSDSYKLLFGGGK